MKRHYIQSIGTFAIVLPLVVALLFTGIISLVKSSLLGDYKESKKIYKSEQAQLAVLEKLEKQLAKKKKQLAQWEQLLVGDSFTKVNEQLRQSITSSNKTKTLQRIDQKRTASPAYAVDAPRSACEFVLEGTFSEMQQCLTKLECALPNLMVNTMSIKPQTSGKLLNLKLNYTIWEKEQ